jgi:hypothetical protein
MILRPEGKDRRSGVADAFPKPHRGNREVDEPIAIHGLPVADGQLKSLVALSTPARGASDGTFSQNGGDAEDVPNSVAVIAFIRDLGHIVGRQP